jgi:hypothetical protein
MAGNRIARRGAGTTPDDLYSSLDDGDESCSELM